MLPNTPEDEGLEPSQSSAELRSGGLRTIPRRFGVWVRGHWTRPLLVAVVGLGTVVGMTVVGLMIAGGGADVEQADPPAALHALDLGRFAEARRLAKALEQREDLPPEAWGVAAYVQGVAAAREAEETISATKRDFYLLAARFLKEARDRGFPANREDEGLLLLGRSLYFSGQYGAARDVLQEALKAKGARATEVCRLLAGACQHGPEPPLAEALQYNDRVLAEPQLTPEVRQEVLLQRAETQLRLGKLADATATLDSLAEETRERAAALLLRGWVLVKEAQHLQGSSAPGAATHATARLQAALQSLRAALRRDTLADEISSKAAYLIGVCLLQMGDTTGALEQFQRTAREYPDGPEALAAGFQAAELHRRSGNDREALAAYRRVLGSVGHLKDYDNPWYGLEPLRAGILDAYQAYFDAQKFSACLQLTERLSPLFARPRAVQLTAETYQAWGHSLLAQADALGEREAAPLLHRGRELLRRAGQSYARLAALRITDREYPDDLWASAENYLQGQDFTAAAKVFGEYLKNESRRRYPRALVNLGEALLSMGRRDEALKALAECIQFHARDTASFRARLLAAHAYAEAGKPAQAEKLLGENLRGDLLSPGSQEWRESLFALGRLLHAQGRYQDAIARLEEAVARYPNSEETSEGRYLLAECHRLHARQAAVQMDKEVLESARQDRAREAVLGREVALEQYQALEADLIRRQAAHELGALEKAILRNSSFSAAAMLFDLGRYEAAAKAYQAIANRCYGSPEALEAYVQLARSYRRLNKPNEAKSVVEQAKIALAKIDDDRRFTETTNYSKAQWSDVLNRLASL